MSNADSTIIIAGGGIPGLTLAVLLGRLGVAVAVIDPTPLAPAQKKSTDSRTSALMQDSLHILQATGAWPQCRDAGGTMRALAIIDDSTSPAVKITFSADEIGQEIFGVNMPNAILRDVLLAEAIKIPAIKFHAPAKLATYTVDDAGIRATLEGGTILRAHLIVGADGRASSVRAAAGIKAREKTYGQQAITCLIGHTLPHHETSTEFHRPSGPFTLVPLPGNTASVVWVDFDAPAAGYMAMNRTAFIRALQDRSNGLLGEIDLLTPPQGWPLQSLQAERLTAPRTALIAEAAHVLHPLGAQGLNLSLRDAAALAEILADALRLGQDPGSPAVLAQYEVRRRREISSRVFGTDALNRMVSTASPAARFFRRAGLKTLDNVTFLKDFAMRQGMAPDNAQSRLARGLPL